MRAFFKAATPIVLLAVCTTLVGMIMGFTAGTMEERTRAQQRADREILLNYDNPSLEIHP